MTAPALLLTLSGLAFLAAAVLSWRRGRAIRRLKARLGVRGERRLGDVRRNPRLRRLAVALSAGVVGGLVAQARGALLGAVLAFVLLEALARRAAAQERLAEEEAWPDVLHELWAGLEAGLALFAVLEPVARKTPPPLGPLLARFGREVALGTPVGEACEILIREGRTPTAALFAGAVRLQAEAGGSLSPSLRTLEAATRARIRLRRKVQALTAQGRLSALVLFGLPPALVVLLLFLDPPYLLPLVTTGMGRVLLGASVLAMGVGALWIRGLIRFGG